MNEVLTAKKVTWPQHTIKYLKHLLKANVDFTQSQ